MKMNDNMCLVDLFQVLIAEITRGEPVSFLCCHIYQSQQLFLSFTASMLVSWWFTASVGYRVYSFGMPVCLHFFMWDYTQKVQLTGCVPLLAHFQRLVCAFGQHAYTDSCGSKHLQAAVLPPESKLIMDISHIVANFMRGERIEETPAEDASCRYPVRFCVWTSQASLDRFIHRCKVKPTTRERSPAFIFLSFFFFNFF